MPPRFAYWTIIVDNQPTSFRSSSIEELMPTFNRLKQKNPSAVMMWFQNGRLWTNRLDAQEAMRLRGEQSKQKTMEGRGFSPGRHQRPMEGRGFRGLSGAEGSPGLPKDDLRGPDGKLEWKPKGSFVPAARRPRSPQSEARSPQSEVRDPKRWRPGGEHKDPRQKYKDAKKAKWTRFKQKVRSRRPAARKKSS